MAFLSSPHLVIAPVALPLVSAILTLMFPRFARGLSLLGAVAILGAAMALVVQSAAGNDAVYLLGNWQAPFGIALLSDRLSAWAVLAGCCSEFCSSSWAAIRIVAPTRIRCFMCCGWVSTAHS